jgi:hypothetical protein
VLSIMTDIAIARLQIEINIQVAAIETIDTIIIFCRLSNMLCGVVEGSAICDDVLGGMVFDDTAVVGKETRCYIV